MEFVHRTVLLEPAVDALLNASFGKRRARGTQASEVAPPLNGIYVDGTFGRGGHSRLLLERLGPDATLVVFDKDPQAIEVARELSERDSRVRVVHGGFGDMPEHLEALGIRQVNGVLLDLGVSSPQIDDASRGFSFMRDGPLDMRMDTSSGPTAAEWLEHASLEEIKEVIANYGEERFAFQIQRRLLLAANPGRCAPRSNSPSSSPAPSALARKASIRPHAAFKLYGFTSTKNSRNSLAPSRQL